MVGWEYRHGLVRFEEVGPLLNELGEQGWELVQVMPAPQYLEVDRRTHYDKVQYFLKRPKSSPSSESSDAATPASSAKKVPVRIPRI
jgi:hypothetical protein